MDNIAKALEIAGGILLAVIIMALIVYFFSNISEWPQQEETMESAEQLSKFNLEYEVYEKSTMYGVDVISCLNKAQSNNEKYIEGHGFLSGNKYNDEFTVDVVVKLQAPLKESIDVYYLKKEAKTGKELEQMQNEETTIKLKELKIKEIPENSDNDKYYTGFTGNDDLYQPDKELKGTNYLNGDYEEYSVKSEQVQKLLNFSSKNPKIEVRNSDKTTYNIWNRIVWKTALYDFKTRFFSCEGIEYSKTTGRVNKITFAEVDR